MRGTLLVMKKELIEFMKDRKTIFFLAFPMLLYPLIFGMMTKLGRQDADKRKSSPSRVVLVDPSSALKPVLEKDAKTFTLVGEPDNLSKAIADDKVDIKVVLPADAAEAIKQGSTFEFEAQYDNDTSSSSMALERLQKVLDSERVRIVESRFQSMGGQQALGTPFKLKEKKVGDLGRTLSKMLGMWLPYILIISMYMGAMQHGAYMSAGERERGTLMSLLSTRLPRRDIILGKQFSLFLLSILSAIFQLLGMAIGIGRLGLQEASSSAAKAAGGEANQTITSLGAMADPKTLLLTLLLMIPIGLLFTAIVMLVGVQARNTREATTALTPGMFLVIMLGVFAMAPGVEKMAALPWVPVVNVLVTIRKLFSAQFIPWEYVVALSMTVLLATVMTWVATRILNRESALFRA